MSTCALGASMMLALLTACTPTPPDVEACAPGAVVVGTSAADLQRALDDARPGDVLQLAEQTYAGNFTITASGTADDPITLCGSGALEGPSLDTGYVLHLDGAAHWVLDGFAVRGGQKGIMLDEATNNTLSGLTVSGTGHEGIHLRTHSTDNLVQGNTISDTGRTVAEYGEGIYVGSAESNWCTYTDCEPDRSDRNAVTDNVVTAVPAEAIDIKEGTTGGIVRGNTLSVTADPAADSVIDVKGNDWQIIDNALDAGAGDGIQVHEIIAGWAQRNTIADNRISAIAPGTAIAIVGAARGGQNVVSCDNLVDDGKSAARPPDGCV